MGLRERASAARAGIILGVPPLPDDALERFRVTLDLHEAGIEIMRQNLRRQHPEEGEREISDRLREWLHTRPGAEHGDAPGGVRAPAGGE